VALREVQTDVKRVETAELTYQLQAKKLQAAQKKYDVGLSTSFVVLDFQEDLVNASVGRIGAIAGYHRSVIELWNTLGITMRQNGIEFDDPQTVKAFRI